MSVEPSLKSSLLRRFAVFALLLALSGCQNIQNDGTRTRTEGALGGAVLGAGLGALIGAASGNAGRGALIGLAAGSVTGLAYGNHVANKKANYRSTEAWLDACIAQAETTLRQTQRYHAQLQRQIQLLQSKQDGGENPALQREGGVLQKELLQHLQLLKDEIGSQQYVLRQANGAATARRELQTKVSALRGTQDQLEESRTLLAAINREGGSEHPAAGPDRSPNQPRTQGDRQDVPDPDALKRGRQL